MRYYDVGDYIPGVPTSHPYGEWIQINTDHSIGSAASGATHASDDYEALYLYIRQQYLGESAALAQASWTANTAITPDYLSIKPNTWDKLMEIWRMINQYNFVNSLLSLR